MYTQCPDCQTRFRVTAGALRAARGTVRCGRCGSAFDALERLSDAMQPVRDPSPLLMAPISIQLASLGESLREPLGESLGEPEREEPSAEATSVLVDESRGTETITLEGERVSFELQPEREEPPAQEPDPDATDHFEILRIEELPDTDDGKAERELEALVQRLQREFGPDVTEPDEGSDAAEATAETLALLEPATPELAPDQSMFVEIVAAEPVRAVPAPQPVELPVELPAELPVEPFAAEPPAPALEPTAAAAEPVEVEFEPEPRVAPVLVPQPPPVAFERVAAAATPVEELPLAARRWRTAPVDVEPEPEATSGRSIWGTLAWTAGSLLLALLLAGQLAHHWREQLARDARTGPTLRLAYERLGLELPTSWDLAAIELRQWGNDDRDSGRMVVRASLTNRAAFAQPNPILRLQFEDRYGSMIAARDFEPSEYLPRAAEASRMLAPGTSSEAELVLADPGPEAVGYRLDVCQRDGAGQLRCAQDPG
jgi:predicted Zn finger-like uncharacterized protein